MLVGQPYVFVWVAFYLNGNPNASHTFLSTFLEENKHKSTKPPTIIVRLFTILHHDHQSHHVSSRTMGPAQKEGSCQLVTSTTTTKRRKRKMTPTTRAGKQQSQAAPSPSPPQEASPFLVRRTSSVLSEGSAVERSTTAVVLPATTKTNTRFLSSSTTLWSIQILIGFAVIVWAMIQNGDEW